MKEGLDIDVKVIEQIVRPDDTKIETVKVGDKKYKRVSKDKYNGLRLREKAVWRRYKTNHQVKKEENKKLEEIYKDKIPTRHSPDYYMGDSNIMASGSTIHHEFVSIGDGLSSKEREVVERAIANEKKLLSAVKKVKDMTNFGLKESKEFAESFFTRKAVSVFDRMNNEERRVLSKNLNDKGIVHTTEFASDMYRLPKRFAKQIVDRL